MKKLLLIAAILMAKTTYSQWVFKTIDNGIDVPYKIAYCTSSDKKGLLKMEQGDEGVALYLTGSYFCDENPSVDVALMVNGEPQRYNFYGYKSQDNETVFIIVNMLDEDRVQFLKDFKMCTKFIIRINETHCTSDIYSFNMLNSIKAFEFMSKEKR